MKNVQQVINEAFKMRPYYYEKLSNLNYKSRKGVEKNPSADKIPTTCKYTYDLSLMTNQTVLDTIDKMLKKYDGKIRSLSTSRKRLQKAATDLLASDTESFKRKLDSVMSKLEPAQILYIATEAVMTYNNLFYCTHILQYLKDTSMDEYRYFRDLLYLIEDTNNNIKNALKYENSDKDEDDLRAQIILTFLQRNDKNYTMNQIGIIAAFKYLLQSKFKENMPIVKCWYSESEDVAEIKVAPGFTHPKTYLHKQMRAYPKYVKEQLDKILDKKQFKYDRSRKSFVFKEGIPFKKFMKDIIQLIENEDPKFDKNKIKTQ